MIPLKQGHLIINLRTREYVFVPQGRETWDGDWKARYPHLAGCGYLDIANPFVWPHDVVNGIPFTYELTRDGGLFALWVDEDIPGEQINKAKTELRTKRDVVRLRVCRLKQVKQEGGGACHEK